MHRIRQLLVVVLTFAFSSSVLASELTWSPSELLSGSWRHEASGSYLDIQPGGVFEIHSENGNVVLAGELKVICWEHLDWHPASLSDAIILKIVISDREWVVSGYYLWGEGDRPGIELLTRMLPSEFSTAFGIDWDHRVLWLFGPGPHE